MGIAAESGRIFKSLIIKPRSLSISQGVVCSYAGARLSQQRSDPSVKQMPWLFQPTHQRRHGARPQPAQQVGTAGSGSPKPNLAAFLGEAFPHGLEAESPGQPVGCPPIWDSALLAHSLLTPQQNCIPKAIQVVYSAGAGMV